MNAMTGSIRLGRVFGIDIRAHWSLLVVAGLILFGLADDVLPTLDPGRATFAYWIAGGGIVALFYTCLLAHELAHSLLAKRRGIEVRRITLWLLGGVSELGSTSHSATEELAVAVAGPATSFALGLIFAAVALLSSSVDGFGLLTASLGWLAVINIVLAVFNLLPAFPLDGGRVLRAAMWLWYDDEAVATRKAGGVSAAVAYGLIASGLLLLLAGAGLSGLWFAVLGWFVLGAARAESQQIRLNESLEGLTAGQLMSSDPVTVPPELTIAELVDRFVLGHRFSAYPVVDPAGRPLGLVTLDSIRQIPPSHRAQATVGQAMCPIGQVPLADPGQPAVDLLGPMTASVPGRAIVLRDGRVAGILSLSDIARAVEAHNLLDSFRT